jgi:hypothetical protein
MSSTRRGRRQRARESEERPCVLRYEGTACGNKASTSSAKAPAGAPSRPLPSADSGHWRWPSPSDHSLLPDISTTIVNLSYCTCVTLFSVPLSSPPCRSAAFGSPSSYATRPILSSSRPTGPTFRSSPPCSPTRSATPASKTPSTSGSMPLTSSKGGCQIGRALSRAARTPSMRS